MADVKPPTRDEYVVPFYALSSTDDVLATHQRAINKAEYDLYSGMLVDDEGEEAPDIHALVATIAARLSRTHDSVQARLEALEMLTNFPKTSSLVYRDYIIDLTRLHYMMMYAKDLDPALYPVFDDALFRYLDPKHPSQELPGTSTLRNVVKRIINQIQPVPEEPERGPKDEGVYFSPFIDESNPGGHCDMNLGEFRYKLLEKTLNEIAKENDCDLPEAVELLCTDKGQVGIQIHLFKAQDSNAVSGQYVEVKASEMGSAIERAKIIDDTVPAPKRNCYQFSEKQKWQIRGRDGVCRFPGCTRSAWNTDIDHVVPYDDNGETDIANAQCLCRRHHMLKTRRIVSCEMDPDSFAVKWTMPDGSILYTHPQGPMAPVLQKTVMTLSELRGKHCAAAATERARLVRQHIQGECVRAEDMQEAKAELREEARRWEPCPF